jgi:hypothetical protein
VGNGELLLNPYRLSVALVIYQNSIVRSIVQLADLEREVIMPVVNVGHHPELTLETAMEVFQKHFSGKYEVYKPALDSI